MSLKISCLFSLTLLKIFSLHFVFCNLIIFCLCGFFLIPNGIQMTSWIWKVILFISPWELSVIIFLNVASSHFLSSSEIIIKLILSLNSLSSTLINLYFGVFIVLPLCCYLKIFFRSIIQLTISLFSLG